MPRTRNENFNMRLRPEELKMLRALAEQRGETASALVRGMIRDRYAARFGASAKRSRNPQQD